MTYEKVVVVGATGLVGLATVREALRRGWQTTGAARSLGRMPSEVVSHPRFDGVEADVMSGEGRSALSAAVEGSSPMAILVAINVSIQPGPLLSLEPEELSQAVSANLISHLALAGAIVPRLAAGSRYVVCGGGTADVVIPGLAAQSVIQSGLRMLVRGLAAESKAHDVRVDEALIGAMVRPSDEANELGPYDMIDADVALALCDLLEDDFSVGGDPIIGLSPQS